jgi:hypothetical protein
MRILIDSLGLQARIHRQDGRRLATFLLELERIPDCAIRFSPPAPLSGELLGEVDVLVITTRKIADNPYTEVDILEAHPEMTLCFHNVFVVAGDNSSARLYYTDALPDTLTFAAASRISTPTASHVARSDVLASLPEWRLKIWNGDVLLRLWCAHHGQVGYLNEVMAVYRRHPRSLTAKVIAQPEKRFTESIYLYQQLDRDTDYQHTDALQERVQQEQEAWRRQRLDWRYYLIRPGQFVARLKQYAEAVASYRNGF